MRVAAVLKQLKPTCRIERKPEMNSSSYNSKTPTFTAIESLMNAYDACTNNEAKEAIFAAVKEIMQLDHALGKSDTQDSILDNDGSCDPSEYCAAV
jgi:hypothetical protein